MNDWHYVLKIFPGVQFKTENSYIPKPALHSYNEQGYGEIVQWLMENCGYSGCWPVNSKKGRGILSQSYDCLVLNFFLNSLHIEYNASTVIHVIKYKKIEYSK